MRRDRKLQAGTGQSFTAAAAGHEAKGVKAVTDSRAYAHREERPPLTERAVQTHIDKRLACANHAAISIGKVLVDCSKNGYPKCRPLHRAAESLQG